MMRVLEYIALSAKENVRNKQRRSFNNHVAMMLATGQVGLKGMISSALVFLNVLRRLTLIKTSVRILFEFEKPYRWLC